MTQTKFDGILTYLRAILLSNLVGGFASFVTSLLIFLIGQNQGTKEPQSFFYDAFNVSILLFPIGLMYCIIFITPIVIFLRKRKLTFQIASILVASVPGLLLMEGGYWGVLAIIYGLSTALFFLRIYPK